MNYFTLFLSLIISLFSSRLTGASLSALKMCPEVFTALLSSVGSFRYRLLPSTSSPFPVKVGITPDSDDDELRVDTIFPQK